MKICVYGLWHLGSVVAASLASLGHEVVGLDMDANNVEKLSVGEAPLYEPGLDKLLQAGIESRNLRFSRSASDALSDVDFLWVTFDTPVDDEDRADVAFVQSQVENVMPFLRNSTIVFVSSQMPVGSIRKLEAFACKNIPEKNLAFACSPENLRLGKALEVFLNPDRMVVGVRDDRTRMALEKLLSPVTEKIEWMSVESAEMTKHAINSFLAVSVTFANEIASICEFVGANAKEVERGLKTEARIGPKAYLSPGGPFAGGTLARDIEFLGIESKEHNLSTPLLSAVRVSNDQHKYWVRRKLQQQFSSLAGLTVAIWGLTYKPGTDTLRRSFAVELCDWLLEQRAELRVYDPAVKQLPEKWAGRVIHCLGALEAVRDSKVLVVATEWPEFKQSALGISATAERGMMVVDANRFLQAVVSQAEFNYVAVGTPPKSRQA